MVLSSFVPKFLERNVEFLRLVLLFRAFEGSVDHWFIQDTARSMHMFRWLIKGSLEEILPSYEKLRSVCAHVRDAKRSRPTVARVGTLGAGRLRRGCGAVAARLRRGPRLIRGIAFL